MMENWEAIRRFYESVSPEILAEKSNEWAIDPYAWESAGIRLTQIEDWLWHDIRTIDLVLYPQFPVAGFFVDFANPKEKVAIECDGAAFHKDKEKDAARDRVLRSMGWYVYRISGKDCRDGVDNETPSKSAARKFLHEVADMHAIQRDGGWR